MRVLIYAGRTLLGGEGIMRGRSFVFFLYLVVFATGSAGLIYQVAWQKYLSRMLGADSIATAIILGVFLGGLSAGYYLCGVFTTRVKNHFKAFAVLEGIIGAWALLFPPIFATVEKMTAAWSFSVPYLMIFQGFFSCVLLIGIPTVAMGGTIPFLTRAVSERIEEATRVTARVYSINTAGAFLGALLAGFYLLPEYGLPLTVMTTAVINLAAFLFFYALGLVCQRREALPVTTQEALAAEPVSRKTVSPALYAIAFLSGFYVMTLENILMRLSALSLGSSSYTYSLIVSVFIFSIALGSHFVGRLREIPERYLYFNQLFIALSLLLIYLSLDTWPYASHVLRVAFQDNMAGFWAYWASVFGVLLLVLIVPVSFMGATVPLVFHFAKRELAQAGRHAGYVFSLNTLGNLLGSIVGGALFYQFLDLPGIYLVAVFLSGISACLAGRYLGRGYLFPALALSACALVFIIATPFFETGRFKIGTFRKTAPGPYTFAGPGEFFRHFYSHLNLVYHKDGSTATVSVVEGKEREEFNRKSRAIIVNGKSDSDTLGDMITLKLLAHLPALLSPERDRVMVIGLGTGVTAGELTLYPDIKEIHIAEISPEVIKAAPFFREDTHDLLSDPRIRFHLGDAFRILGRSPGKYDLIISEPSNPWTVGVDLLFTREFYSLAARRLTERGILLQWMHTYSADPAMVGMVLNTISNEFKNVQVFLGEDKDLLILASNREFTAAGLAAADETIRENKRLRASLKEIEIESIEALLMRQLLTDSYIRDHFSGSGIQSADFPRLHYRAGKAFFLNSHVPQEDFFNSGLAPYAGEYLLSLRHPGWGDLGKDRDRRGIYELTLRELPLFARALSLRAHLADPRGYPLSEQGSRDRLDPVLQIAGIGSARPEEGSRRQEAASREAIEGLINQMRASRNWIIPYPVTGLESLLRGGMKGARTAEERNWHGLKLVSLLIGEGRELKPVKEIFARLERDGEGRLLLKAGDRDLGDNAARLLASYAARIKKP